MMMPKIKLTTSAINSVLNKRFWAPLVPYFTIGIGLLVLNNAWVAILGYHLSMIITLFFTGRIISFTQIRKSNNYKILIITSVLGGTGGLILFLVWPLLGIPGDIKIYLENIGLTTAMWPYFIAYFVLINPWLEEYYWRGYLGNDSKWITINDLLFSGYHIIVLAGKIDVIWLIIIFIVLSLVAWFWRQANRWNQGISASIASHISGDISVIFTIYFLYSRI
jgi:membrane protease YdiL (CAAX protease family)